MHACTFFTNKKIVLKKFIYKKLELYGHIFYNALDVCPKTQK